MKGYLEFNIIQHSYTFTEDSEQTEVEQREIGLHYCNQEDRKHFYDQTELPRDMFRTFSSFY